EEMAHEAFQQRLERSIANDIFSTKRQQFIGFGGAMEQVDCQVFISDGANQPNVDFWQSSEAAIAIGRPLHGYFQGGPQDFIGKAQSAFKGGPTAFRGGISAQWETHGETGVGTTDFDAIFGTAGLEYKNGNGLSARGYIYVLNVDPDTGDDFF